MFNPLQVPHATSFVLAILASLALGGCSSTPQAPKKRFDSSREYRPSAPTKAQRTADENSITRDPGYLAMQNLYQKGQYEQVIARGTALEKRVSSTLSLAYVRNLKGLSYLAMRKPLLAIVQFQRALDYHPPESIKPYLQYNLAAALSDADQVDDALETLKEIHPEALNHETRAKFFSVKGKNLLAKEDWVESARATLEAARAAGPVNGVKASYVELLDRALSQIPQQENLHQVIAGLEDSPLADRIRQRIIPGLNLEAPPATTFGDSRTVGVLLPLSGRFSDFGSKVLHAITLAFKIYDPNGERFKLEIEDTGDTVERTIRAMNRLANERNVSVVIGPLLSRGIEQITSRAETLGLPLITLTQQQGIRGDYVFSAGLTAKMQATAVANVAIQKLGLKRFAIVYPRDRFGEEYSQSYWDAIEAMGGTVVGIESYASGETDFRQVVDRLVGTHYKDARARELTELAKQREELKITRKTRRTAQYFDLPPIVEFDAVFIPDEPKIIGQILPTFAYRDVDRVRFLGISPWNSPELVKRAQAFAEGAVFTDGLFSDSESVPAQKFITRFARDQGESPSTIEAMAYDAGLAVEHALSQLPSGTVQRSDVRNRLRSISNLAGATGKITYRDGEFTRELTLLTVKSGRIVELK